LKVLPACRTFFIAPFLPLDVNITHLKPNLLLCSLLLLSVWLQAQIIAGPMLGPVELRDAKLWLEVSPSVKTVQLVYGKKGSSRKNTIQYNGALGKAFNPIQLEVGGLDINTTYDYHFIVDGRPARQKGSFTTKDLWQWRKPAPDFSFLTGSCAYFNEPEYDRPGKPYGGDSTIFETMAREKAAFMLWLGDNWYTREVDYSSEWGLWYRPHRDRSMPVLQNFLKAMPHLAVWDDHDYGADNMGKSYILKETSREIFKNYWLNKSYGLNGQGIYTQYSHADVDIFMLDNRWWRSDDHMQDSVNGQPNPDKRMFGREQMTWLKNALLASSATFKLVVTAGQALNPLSTTDRWTRFPAEYHDFMNFLTANRINGVLFISGDRHHSAITRVNRSGTYPLYDITTSPLTAGTHGFSADEADSPYRVFGLVGKQNYSRFTISGPEKARKLMVQFLGVRGENLGEWSITEAALKTPD
jgi:alkaline phosphatase D